MPTSKKTSDNRQGGSQNMVKLSNKVAVGLRVADIGQVLRKKEGFAEKLSNGKLLGNIASAHQECRLPPGAGTPRIGPLTLMVADDHPVVREGLVTMIERQSDLRVVAQASTGREAVEKFLAFRPDVGLVDLRMPLMNGVETVVAICEREPAARLIILTTYQGQEDIYRALRAGASGYLLKDAPAEELVESIRAVSSGKTWIPPAVGAMLAKRLTDRDLTAREMEVLRILAVGKSNKEIGVAFNISEATVKVHITHILEKLKVTGRTEAINVAVRRGLVNMDSTMAA